jgi:hypothetical protein
LGRDILYINDEDKDAKKRKEILVGLTKDFDTIEFDSVWKWRRSNFLFVLITSN